MPWAPARHTMRCRRSVWCRSPVRCGQPAQHGPTGFNFCDAGIGSKSAAARESRRFDLGLWRREDLGPERLREGVVVERVLGEILRAAVWDRLNTLQELASNATDSAVLSAAHHELPWLIQGWHEVLAIHTPDLRGYCPECSTRWHPCAAPCSVWRAAQQHFVLADSTIPPAPAVSCPPVSTDSTI